MAEQTPSQRESSTLIGELLAPLVELGESGQREVQQETKYLQTVERKYQSVKALYASAFQRVQKLEDKARDLRNEWRVETE